MNAVAGPRCENENAEGYLMAFASFTCLSGGPSWRCICSRRATTRGRPPQPGLVPLPTAALQRDKMPTMQMLCPQRAPKIHQFVFYLNRAPKSTKDLEIQSSLNYYLLSTHYVPGPLSHTSGSKLAFKRNSVFWASLRPEDLEHPWEVKPLDALHYFAPI